MTTLLIRLAPATSPDDTFPTVPDCTFARISAQGTITRQGNCPLPDLAQDVAGARQVTVLLAACDAGILQREVPPLPAARLKAALPFLVEDGLLDDPARCAIVAGPDEHGMRMLAMARRDWLQSVTDALLRMGARALRVLPSQACLPHDGKIATAALRHSPAGVELALRPPAGAALGLVLTHDGPAQDIAALRVVYPQGPLTLLVPPAASAAYAAYAAYVAAATADDDITIAADDWSHWIAGAAACKLDLAEALGVKRHGPPMQWHQWRRPLALAGTLLALNLLALNADWWRLSRQARALQASMTAAYRQAYPGDKVIIDPLAQARQKRLTATAHGTTDEFDKLLTGFSNAWETTAAERQNARLAALEYRDGTMLVRLSGGNDNGALAAALQRALAIQQLTWSPASSNAWRVSAANATGAKP